MTRQELSKLKFFLDSYITKYLQNESFFIITPTDVFLPFEEDEMEIPPMGLLGYQMDANSIHNYFEHVISDD